MPASEYSDIWASASCGWGGGRGYTLWDGRSYTLYGTIEERVTLHGEGTHLFTAWWGGATHRGVTPYINYHMYTDSYTGEYLHPDEVMTFFFTSAIVKETRRSLKTSEQRRMPLTLVCHRTGDTGDYCCASLNRVHTRISEIRQPVDSYTWSS